MDIKEAIDVLNQFGYDGHSNWHQVGLWAEPSTTPEGEGRIVEREVIAIAERLLRDSQSDPVIN